MRRIKVRDDLLIDRESNPGLNSFSKLYDQTRMGAKAFANLHGMSLKAAKAQNTRRKGKEFTPETKLEAFLNCNGICEVCKTTIVEGWKSAVYHHRKLVRDGGTRSVKNCMPLHYDCHWSPENFKKLHGFPVDSILNRPVDIFRRNICQK